MPISTPTILSAASPSQSSGQFPLFPSPSRILKASSANLRPPSPIPAFARTSQGIAALSEGYLPLGKISQGQARHVQDCALCLYATRVGDHKSGVHHKGEEI